MAGPTTVLAEYKEHPIFKQGGDVMLYEDLEVGFERLIFMSAISMSEQIAV